MPESTQPIYRWKGLGTSTYDSYQVNYLSGTSTSPRGFDDYTELVIIKAPGAVDVVISHGSAVTRERHTTRILSVDGQVYTIDWENDDLPCSYVAVEPWADDAPPDPRQLILEHLFYSPEAMIPDLSSVELDLYSRNEPINNILTMRYDANLVTIPHPLDDDLVISDAFVDVWVTGAADTDRVIRVEVNGSLIRRGNVSKLGDYAARYELVTLNPTDSFTPPENCTPL